VSRRPPRGVSQPDAYPLGYGAADTERRVDEPPKATSATRSAFQRDRARVLHSSALRRLAAKTQVVGVEEQEGVPRTRLTHSLECAQVGRELGATLGANADLVDAACLAHDLGHPPFGHNGETALAAAAEPCGGFEGNAQSFRELVRLEPKVEGAGLNLTRAALDAATKYPWARRQDSAKFGVYDDDLPAFEWMRAGRSAPSDPRRCLEAQVMDWADDVAYSVHDLEDGVLAGLVDLGTLADSGLRRELVDVAAAQYGVGDDEAYDRLRREPWWVAAGPGTAAGVIALKAMTSELIARFAGAARDATRAAEGAGPLTRYAASLHVPERVRAECALLKAVTAHLVMDRTGASAQQERERAVLGELCTQVAARAPDVLDAGLTEAWHAARDDAARLRVVIDQVARLTDTSALRWHARLLAS